MLERDELLSKGACEIALMEANKNVRCWPATAMRYQGGVLLFDDPDHPTAGQVWYATFEEFWQHHGGAFERYATICDS